MLTGVYASRFPPSTHLVIAFTGAPAQFPVEQQHVSLHRYLQWSDYIEELANSFIRANIPGRPFLGIHLRNDVDWVKLSVAIHRPVASLLTTGGRFPHILDLFRGMKIGVPTGCLGETSSFKMIMIDDVTLWSKLESTWQVY